MIKIYVTVECKNNLITTIPFKGVKVQVEFTGGNVMKNIPARFYCNDPFTQKALDESDQNGLLFRLARVVPEDGDQQGNTPAAKPQGTVKPEPAKPAAQEPSKAPEPPKEPEKPADDGAGDGASDKKLEFENLAAAIVYCAANFGEQCESESQVRKLIEEKTGEKCVIHKG